MNRIKLVESAKDHPILRGVQPYRSEGSLYKNANVAKDVQVLLTGSIPEHTEPVLLVAGGSGVVPLMAMVRARAAAASRAPFRLLYSVRSEPDTYYRDELLRRVRDDRGLDVTLLYTRVAPTGHRRPARSIDDADIREFGWPPDFEPRCYVCGSTPFVEAVADLLVAAGHDPMRIRTERYGGIGG